MVWRFIAKVDNLKKHVPGYGAFCEEPFLVVEKKNDKGETMEVPCEELSESPGNRGTIFFLIHIYI